MKNSENIGHIVVEPVRKLIRFYFLLSIDFTINFKINFLARIQK